VGEGPLPCAESMKKQPSDLVDPKFYRLEEVKFLPIVRMEYAGYMRGLPGQPVCFAVWYKRFWELLLRSHTSA
jgi:hypothetical protein